MIIYADTRPKRDRYALAIETLTGNRPSVFALDHGTRGRQQWRIQEDSMGNAWKDALLAYLDPPGRRGRSAATATHANVWPHHEDYGIDLAQ